MKPNYRVAFAGCHRMLLHELSHHNFAAAFHAVPEAEMVAVFDFDAKTRSEFLGFWGKMPEYEDYSRMLSAVRPDIVCIATRQTMHADQIEQAAASGVRGILCDKPLATSLTECDRIVAACRNHSVALLFGLDRRWQQPYQHLRRRIAEGIVGPIRAAIVHGLPNLINHGCHWYDTALLLLSDPEPVWVSGFVNDVAMDPPHSRRRLDPPGSAQIGLDNGTTVFVTSTGGPHPSFEIIGEEGRLFILDDARAAFHWTGAADPQRSGMRALDLPPHAEDWPSGPAMVRDLIQAFENGRSTACDTEQARRATEIGFAIHLSHMQSGARIDLPAAERSLRIPSFPWGNE